MYKTRRSSAINILKWPIFLWLLLLFLTACLENPARPRPEEEDPPTTEENPPADTTGNGETGFVWPIVEPGEKHLNAERFTTLDQKIANGDYGQISSLLVVRDSALVFESYYRGWSATSLHPVYSVTKSIASGLIGIAHDRDLISTVQDPIYTWLFPYKNNANPDERKDRITLEHVLKMRAGFAWDEWSVPYGTAANPLNQMMSSRDWLQFVFDFPMAAEPGDEFAYNSGCSVMLSGILNEATETTTRAFAVQYLFEPLDIGNFGWDAATNGMHNTGFGLRMLPRDMAKIGQLYLQDGIWEGERILPSNWIHNSWQRYTTFENGTGYGYQWWIMSLEFEGQHYDVPYADGWGQQYIFVLPDWNMVVVSTAEKYSGESSPIREIIRDFIVAAVED
ncbi:serine hydrolase [candidate division KSB1 bacterium]|nr:serine hydrolase [candidate division KSB1 bacterium]